MFLKLQAVTYLNDSKEISNKAETDSNRKKEVHTTKKKNKWNLKAGSWVLNFRGQNPEIQGPSLPASKLSLGMLYLKF